MKKIVVLLLSALVSLPLAAQDNYFFPAKKGAKLSYKFYDGREKALRNDFKEERWLTFTVDDVWPSDHGAVINVTVDTDLFKRFAELPMASRMVESLSYGDVKIEGDTLVLDNMMAHGMIPTVPGFMSFTAGRNNRNEEDDQSSLNAEVSALATYPRGMKVGDELPDQTVFHARYITELSEKAKKEMEQQREEIRMEMRMHGMGNMPGMTDMPVFYIKAKIKNRKVEGQENIVTPAGTFDCYRISYNVVKTEGIEGMEAFTASFSFGGEGMVSTVSSSPSAEPTGDRYVEWISPEVGLVKRQKFNSRGKKVEESMVLESITNP